MAEVGGCGVALVAVELEHIFLGPVAGRPAVVEQLGSMEFVAGQRIVAQHTMVERMGFVAELVEEQQQFVFALVEHIELPVVEQVSQPF